MVSRTEARGGSGWLGVRSHIAHLNAKCET
ncbi:MAG: hypothetical protein ACI9SC_001848 [Gammaproteobacteria bacterium]|jgi:hypothetical protein